MATPVSNRRRRIVWERSNGCCAACGLVLFSPEERQAADEGWTPEPPVRFLYLHWKEGPKGWPDVRITDDPEGADRRLPIYGPDAFKRPSDALPPYTIDHIIPRARGGGNELENLRVLCVSCNSRKGAKSLDDVREQFANGSGAVRSGGAA